MSTREVERELVTLLHRRAEGAMSSTDTQTEHEKFHEVLEAGGHRDRGPRTFLAAGAAAAAVVIGGVWSSGFGDDGPVRPPTPASTPTSTERSPSDEAVAQDFVKAFADGDLNEAATYLAPGTEPYPGWRREVERNVAFNFEFLVEPCEAKTKTTIGTVVECPFDMHVLYSKELGEGPFTGNMFTVFVEDGAVLEADNVMAWQTNGQEEYFDKVWNWIKRHHPDDVALMAMDEQEVQPAAWPRYLRLWEQHTRDYYQTMTSESDG